jgi:FMN-dependent NADH-azoreductase
MALKTLVVTYTPRRQQSNTQKLVDYFVNHVGDTPLELLDLVQTIPDYFLTDNLAVYYKRNYAGQSVTAAESALMAKMDGMVAQLKACDVVVLAYPMYNFSVPAVVKSYFESVMLRGHTWVMEGARFKGLLTGKRALVLTSSGGVYEGELAQMDFSIPLARMAFQFMGFSEVEVITAAGLNQFPDKVDDLICAACQKVQVVIDRWYV